MTERSLVEAAARLRRQREPHLVATVVNVHGSGYRRPGARMLLTRFRWIAGAVTGGCLEGDLQNAAWAQTRGGAPLLVTLDGPSCADDDLRAAFGLGSDVAVDVLIERGAVPGRFDVLELACECLRRQIRAAVVTVFRSDDPRIAPGTRVALRAHDELGDPCILRDAMVSDARTAIETGESFNRSYATSAGTVDCFVEVILPPPRVFVFGTGHDAVPVARLAKSLGWDVSVIAPEPRETTRQRFDMADEILVGTPGDLAARIDECDRAVALVMSHDRDIDREHLGMLLGTRARYIGVLGPRARTQRLLAEIGRVAEDTRLHAPVGLELGAETPEEIALSIVAEIQADLRRAPATSLREHVGSIHGRTTETDWAAVA
jgi:xanthine dehydrogenase accessory factor